jgi:hypothetical protein
VRLGFRVEWGSGFWGLPINPRQSAARCGRPPGGLSSSGPATTLSARAAAARACALNSPQETNSQGEVIRRPGFAVGTEGQLLTLARCGREVVHIDGLYNCNS